MNIAFDMNAYHGFSKSGIGNYMKDFCISIMQRNIDNTYYFINWTDRPLLNNWIGVYFNSEEIVLGDTKNIESKIRNLVKNYVIDVYVDFSNIGIRESFKREWFGKTILCCFVYDIIPFKMRKEYYSNDIDGYICYLNKMWEYNEYDHLFCDSIFTKNDIIKSINIEENKTTVIYPGHSNKIEANINDNTEFGYRYFLMFSGNAHQKNTIRTLLAYIKAYKKNNKIPKLIIVGSENQSRKNQIIRIICEHNLTDTIDYRGYVNEDELHYLEKNAWWVLYASLYEGFGLPIIDSWSKGIPVLTSNCTSMKEIAEGIAVLVDPLSIDSIVEGILTIANIGDKERKVYINNAQKKLKIFQWEKSTGNFIKKIEEIVNNYSINKTLVSDYEKNKWITKCIFEFETEIGRKINSRKQNEPTNELKKNIWCYQNIHKMLTKREQNKSIRVFFSNNNYSNIAIYGMGVLANHFIIDLKHAEIPIKYIIDENANSIVDEYPIYEPNNNLPIVDVIVITVYDEGIILEKLKNMCSTDIIMIDEIYKI